MQSFDTPFATIHLTNPESESIPGESIISGPSVRLKLYSPVELKKLFVTLLIMAHVPDRGWAVSKWNYQVGDVWLELPSSEVKNVGRCPYQTVRVWLFSCEHADGVDEFLLRHWALCFRQVGLDWCWFNFFLMVRNCESPCSYPNPSLRPHGISPLHYL